MARWGEHRGLSAQGGLLTVGILIAITCWMLATGYDSAAARARSATEYSWRTGRRYNVHGEQVRQPQVSDDGGITWEDVS